MSATDPGLTPEQKQELHDAREAAKSFMGASKIAAMNGWTLAFFAAVSLVFGLFSPTSLVVGVGLAVVARNELVGRKRLLARDPGGLELMWRNQIGLMALIVAYCGWSIYQTLYGADPEMDELMQLLGSETEGLITQLTLLVYGLVIVATVAYQGWNARYYYIRIARLRAYLRETPEWVLDVERE